MQDPAGKRRARLGIAWLAALALSGGALISTAMAAPARGERGQRGQASPQDQAAARENAGGLRDLSNIKVPDGVKFVPDIAYREGNVAWTLDLAMPEELGGAPRPGIVFLHGGGWAGGDKRTGYFLAGALEYAQKGYVCVTANYRLSGKAPFPACVQDTRCAVRWLRAHAKDYNLDPDRIGAYGNSSGAHLAAMLALAVDKDPVLDGDAPYQEYSSAVQAVCSSATPTDFTGWLKPIDMSTPEGRFLAGPEETLEERKRQASPLTYVRKDAPPMLLIQGDADGTVDVGQAKRLYDALKEAGAEDVALLMIYKAGHAVFTKCPDVTKPAMERFFDRTLMHPAPKAEATATGD